MSHTPKHAWGAVKALLHSVYDQPDADAVHAQFDRIVADLAVRLPDVADYLDAARADILAFTGFPKGIWRQIWSNNPNERLNREIRAPNRRRGHLPRPRLRDPADRCGARRAARRMGRITTLHRPRHSDQIPPHHNRRRNRAKHRKRPDNYRYQCIEYKHLRSNEPRVRTPPQRT